MQPPCLSPGVPMNDCARNLYAEKVLGHVDLSADWSGWRLRGRWLVSPEGERINPERLRGILFREAGEQRVARATRANAIASAQVVPWQGKSGLRGVALTPAEPRADRPAQPQDTPGQG